MLIMKTDLSADIAAVQGIAAVPRILEVVCRSTGMGFAAVARVTEQRWVCCAVRDEIQFGLVPGGELEVETTLCHEIGQSHEAVVIDNVTEDASYCGHHTPAKYGFQSPSSSPTGHSSAPCARSIPGRRAWTRRRRSTCSSCSRN